MASQVEAKKVLEALRRFPGELDRQVTQQMKLHGEAFRAAMIDRFQGYDAQASPSRDKLMNRHGQAGLRASFGHDVSGSMAGGEGKRLTVFSAGRKYARIQEYGGDVVPKNVRFLTIPVGDNLTAAGRVRYPSARDLMEQYPGQTFLLKRGERLLVMSRGLPGKAPPKKGKPKLALLFTLKKKVTIPPRLGFRATWRRLEPDFKARMADALRGAARAAGA